MIEKKLSSTDQIFLERMYVSGENTVEEIAEQLVCPTQVVLDYVKKNDLQVKNENEGSSKNAIVFCYSTTGIKYLRKKGDNKSRLLMHRLSVFNYVNNIGYNTVRTYFAHSTYPKTNFFETKEFIEAYKDAEENNYVMIVHDITRLFARLSNNDQTIYLNKIMEGQVEIIDAALNFSTKQAGKGVVRRYIDRAVWQLSLKRTVAKSTFMPKLKANTRIDTKRASLFSKVSARMARDKLKPEIERAIFDLKSAGKVSLQLIADELNRREITSPRGRPWSKGTITNILKKLEIDHRK